MNREQRKYLMDNIKMIYENKKKELNNKYKLDKYDMIRNYIQANKLKLKLDTPEKVKDYIFKEYIDPYIKIGKNIGKYEFLNEEQWYDTTEIMNKIKDNDNMEVMKHKELDKEYYELCDKIMLDGIDDVENVMKKFMEKEV